VDSLQSFADRNNNVKKTIALIRVSSWSFLGHCLSRFSKPEKTNNRTDEGRLQRLETGHLQLAPPSPVVLREPSYPNMMHQARGSYSMASNRIEEFNPG
jgi:hypothetical protein